MYSAKYLRPTSPKSIKKILFRSKFEKGYPIKFLEKTKDDNTFFDKHKKDVVV
jgi:hypothetical protein